MDKFANITHEPLKLCRENPIVVNIDAAPITITDRSKIRYYLELFVPASFLSEKYEKVETYTATEEPIYQSSDTSILPGAFVEIQQYLESLLFVSLPIFAQRDMAVCQGMASPFYTNWIVQNNGVVVSSKRSDTAYAYNGGIAMRDYSAYKDTFFTEFIGGSRRFLTYQSNNKKVLPNSQEFLYFLTNFSPLPTELNLRVQIYYADGTTEIFTAKSLQSITAFSVYCLPVGPTELGLDQLEKSVLSYEVWLNNENNQALSEPRNYILDTKYHKNVKQIMFSGSLGNFDTLTFIGKNAENFKVQKQMSERYSGFDYLPNFSEKVVSKITGEREITVNTGWISKNQGEYLAELLLSREIYLLTDRAFLPITLTNDSYITSDTDEYLVGREFIFSYTNPERMYSNLPISPKMVFQVTAWRAYVYGACLLDANGIRTGYQSVEMIEKYYTKSNVSVRPQVVKKNIPEREGYTEPVKTDACSVTPYYSAKIEKQGSYIRTTCTVGFGGGKATIVIPAKKYGSEISQADADAKAESEFKRTDTQAYADANGICVSSPEFYQVAVADGKFNYRFADETIKKEMKNVFAGGPGSENKNKTMLVYGNGWFIQDNTNPNSILYPEFSNDMALPIDSGTNYRVYVNGYNIPIRLRVWVDGKLIHDHIITASDFKALNYQYQFYMNRANGFMPFPNKAMVYALVTNP